MVYDMAHTNCTYVESVNLGPARPVHLSLPHACLSAPVLYYPGPTKESFTIQVRQRNPVLSRSDKGISGHTTSSHAEAYGNASVDARTGAW